MKRKRDEVKQQMRNTSRVVIIATALLGLLFVYIDRALVSEWGLRGVIGEIMALVGATIVVAIIIGVIYLALSFIGVIIGIIEEVEKSDT